MHQETTYGQWKGVLVKRVPKILGRRRRQLSVKYTPQQNGVAERANRTLVEMARCIMLQANLPQSLWTEAINAATYIRNRCASRVLNNKTPLEMWSNQKPYVGFFRIIGSEVIVLNKRGKRGKFYPKGNKYILVGYSSESKAYRLWRPKTKTVIKARDVRFIEDINSYEDTSFNPNVIDQDPSSSPEDQRQKQEAENNGNCKEDNLRNDLQDDSQLDEEEADSQETSGEEDERQVEQNHHRSEETRRGRGR